MQWVKVHFSNIHVHRRHQRLSSRNKVPFLSHIYLILQHLFLLYCSWTGSCHRSKVVQLYNSFIISCVQDEAFGGRQKTELRSDRYPAMDRTVGRCCRCRGAVRLADMNDCSQRLGFHAAAIFAQARAAGTGRPFDIHLTSKCLLSRSLLSSQLVSPPSVTRPFILRHDFWPERFCCSTYLLFSFFPL